jgi:DNA processing protein
MAPLGTAGRRMSGAGSRTWTIDRDHPDFPAGLHDLAHKAPGAPATVHGIGERDAVAGLEPGAAVTIVGARRAGTYGGQVAEELAKDLAAAGLVIVSGMAHGIDAAAHRGALAGGGTTIAVLGGGPDVVYPAGQRRLYGRILERGGAIISEHPPGTRIERWCFPARNRIMAAVAKVTIVVEATERSGTRITSDWALDLPDREVGAVPGPVNSRLSAGPNALLADGAFAVRDAQDVLDRLLGVGMVRVRGVGPTLEPALTRVLDLVEAGEGTCDGLAVAGGLAPRDAAIALVRLELLGYVRADAAGRYWRTPLAPPEEHGANSSR